DLGRRHPRYVSPLAPGDGTMTSVDPRLEALLLRAEIEAFNAGYAARLDRQDLTAWVDCFTEDAFYVVISRENFERNHPVGLIYCEGRPMIADRAFALLKTAMYGPRFLRHMISNLDVVPQADGSVQARANFVVFEVLTIARTRGCFRSANTAMSSFVRVRC
ncbi:MAG TPA: nuclear transport factor 2 family protein, partial [Rhodopila sp.]